MGAHRAGEGGKEGALLEVHLQWTQVLGFARCEGDTEPEAPESQPVAQQGADRKQWIKAGVGGGLSPTHWTDYGLHIRHSHPEKRSPRATGHLTDLRVSPGKTQGPLRQASRNWYLWDRLSTQSPYSEAPINRPHPTVLPISILAHCPKYEEPQITRYLRTSPNRKSTQIKEYPQHDPDLAKFLKTWVYTNINGYWWLTCSGGSIFFQKCMPNTL